MIAIGSFGFFQHWQASQAARPDYNNPAASQAPSKPSGAAPQSEMWQVVSIFDGDTFTVKDGWKPETIRVCGTDAPEPEQPLGEAAKEKLRSLIQAAGNQVIVFPIEKDRDGSTVGEVFIKASTPEQPEQERSINYEMVASGLAYEYTRYSGSCPNREAINQAERLAQSKHLGVWGGNYQRPWDYRKQQ